MTKFYDHTTYPEDNSRGVAEALRAELDRIEQGFDQVEAIKADKSEIPDTSDFQAKSDILTAIAAITFAANKLLLATGPESFSTLDISDFIKTLLNDANASEARTTLGLAIGSNVQAYSALLAAVAGLTSASNKLPYFTGSNAAAVTDLSVFARTLLDDGDAATARNTLGIDFSTYAALAGATFTGDVIVPDDTYDPSSWNGNFEVPTKKAIRDKLESFVLSVINSTSDPTFSSVSTTDPTSPDWVNGRINAISIGIAQTYQDVGASRAASTTYTNSTGKPIYLCITFVVSSGAAIASLTINGIADVVKSFPNSSGTPQHTIQAIIPNTGTYRISLTGATISKWMELRT